MKALFFDTNVFYSIKFDVDDKVMVSVLELAKKLGIELWISDITKKEIFNGIDRKINDLKSSYDNVSSILKNVCDDKVWLDIAMLEEAGNSTKEQFELFFIENKFKVLGFNLLDESDISKTFDEYFLQTGVFTSKRKMKNKISKEFPDAFQIELIRRSVRCGENIAVISGDCDFENSLNGTDEISLYPSLKRIEKELKAISSGREIHISNFESRILYYLDEHETQGNLLSHLNFHPQSNVSEANVISALKSLCNKNLVRMYAYDATLEDYKEISEDRESLTWYKQCT